MLIEYDSQKIQQALQDFWAATGIDMDLLKPDLTPACAYLLHGSAYCRAIQSTAAGSRACRCSDRALLEKCRATGTMQHHVCHAGLVDVAIPLLHSGACIGYIIFGRMRPSRDLSALERCVSVLGLDRAAAETAYRQIPVYDEDRIRAVSGIATLLVKYILLENMLRPDPADPVSRAADFIRENLDRALSIQDIARGTGISKTVLYKAFHSRLGCTVGSFVNSQRIERSLALLRDTTLSLEEISQRVGFSSASYYSKVFRSIMGLSPLQYRKNSRASP